MACRRALCGALARDGQQGNGASVPPDITPNKRIIMNDEFMVIHTNPVRATRPRVRAG